MNKKLNNNGFSLVELIIVIAIMAVLAASIAPSVIRYIDKTRSTKAYNDAATIYNDAQVVLSEFLAKDVAGSYLGVDDGMATQFYTDPVYGKVGRMTNYKCYQLLTTNDAIANPTRADILLSESFLESSAYTTDQLNASVPTNTAIGNLPQTKTSFMVVYNNSGVIYVELFEKGYFVHYDGSQSVDDVVAAKKDPTVTFSDVR